MKVLIVDYSASVQQRLTAMLTRIAGAENTRYAGDETEATDSIQKLNLDAPILDTRTRGVNQMDVPHKTSGNSQTDPVLAIPDQPYRQNPRNCVETGTSFFFDKSTECAGVMSMLGCLGQIRC